MHVHICDTGNWEHDILSPGTLITGMGGVCTLITRSGGGMGWPWPLAYARSLLQLKLGIEVTHGTTQSDCNNKET